MFMKKFLSDFVSNLHLTWIKILTTSQHDSVHFSKLIAVVSLLPHCRTGAVLYGPKKGCIVVKVILSHWVHYDIHFVIQHKLQ